MFCSECGNQLNDKAVVCPRCGVPVAGKTIVVAGPSDDAALRMLLPIGRSGLSIIAGYLGLLSLLPFIGIFALIIGIFAILDIRKHPEKHGLGRAWFGVIMGGASSLIYLIVF